MADDECYKLAFGQSFSFSDPSFQFIAQRAVAHSSDGVSNAFVYFGKWGRRDLETPGKNLYGRNQKEIGQVRFVFDQLESLLVEFRSEDEGELVLGIQPLDQFQPGLEFGEVALSLDQIPIHVAGDFREVDGGIIKAN